MELQHDELREAAHLGRDGAGDLIVLAGEVIVVEVQRVELREAAHLGRDRAGEVIAAEGQIGELRVLEELGR